MEMTELTIHFVDLYEIYLRKCNYFILYVYTNTCIKLNTIQLFKSLRFR
jgi:hypothetical protein